MLSLENTASRMSHLARQEIYFDRQFGLDETLAGVERVTAEDVQRVATDLFSDGALAGTVLGPLDGWRFPRERLKLGRACRSRHVRRGPGQHVCRRPRSATPRACSLTTGGPRVIARYTGAAMGRIWSEQRRFESWLQVEIAAAEAMAEAGIIPATAAAGDPRARRLRRRAHRGDRGEDQARRHRVHDGRGRAGGRGGPLAALRPDLVRRHRHRAGAADARGVRPDPRGARRSWARRSGLAPRSTGTRR